MIHVGETLLYTNAGHTKYVRIENIFLDKDGSLRFKVRTKNEEMIETTREFLKSPDDPNIGWIPTTISEKAEVANHLSTIELNILTSPVTLSPL